MARPERKRPPHGDKPRRRGGSGPNPSRGFGLVVVLAFAKIGRLGISLLAKQLGQAIDMGADPASEGVDPLRAGDEQLERRRGLDIGDAGGENRLLLADGALALP